MRKSCTSIGSLLSDNNLKEAIERGKIVDLQNELQINRFIL